MTPYFSCDENVFILSGFQSLIPYNRRQLLISLVPLTSLAKAKKLLLSCTLDMISVRSSQSSTSSLSSRNMPWRPSMKAICFWITLQDKESLFFIPAANVQHYRTKKKISHHKNKHRTNTGLKKKKKAFIFKDMH